MNSLAKLYKYTTKGQVQSWQIFYENNYYWTEEGIHTLSVSDPTYCAGKNIGKANETSPEQQALLEAKAKFQKKLDKGYNTVLTREKKFFEPMLAHEFSKYEKLLFTVRTFIQPKLDGVRCIMDNNTLMTRAGKEVVSCPHVARSYYSFDGELYNHDLKNDFNKIISLTRKTKPSKEDLQESEELIQYWIYDLPKFDGCFSERYAKLVWTFNTNFVMNDCYRLVPTYEIHSMEELKIYHESFIAQGYEGSIIRLDLGPYENKRSKQLLKYKDWMDAEFEIYDVNPGTGNRADCANTLSIVVKDNGDGTGVGCAPTMTGTEDFMRRVLKDKEKIIGKMATIKFFGYTEDGSLRFPTVKCIVDYV